MALLNQNLLDWIQSVKHGYDKSFLVSNRHLFTDGAYDRPKLMEKPSNRILSWRSSAEAVSSKASGCCLALGRRADLWMAEVVAPIGPRLRDTHRRLTHHDNRHGRGQPVKVSWHRAGNPISDTDIGDCD